MSIERSHGKPRPTLPRSRALPPVETARDPSDGRGALGRFAPGNRLSVRQGEKHAVKKLLGDGATDAQATAVGRDALRLAGGALRDLPSDGPVVRSLTAVYAREAAAFGFFSHQADAAGLDTPEGAALAERASKHGQRAERVAVTMLDVASRLAAARPAVPLLSPVEIARRIQSLRAEEEAPAVIDVQPVQPLEAQPDPFPAPQSADVATSGADTADGDDCDLSWLDALDANVEAPATQPRTAAPPSPAAAPAVQPRLRVGDVGHDGRTWNGIAWEGGAAAPAPPRARTAEPVQGGPVLVNGRWVSQTEHGRQQLAKVPAALPPTRAAPPAPDGRSAVQPSAYVPSRCADPGMAAAQDEAQGFWDSATRRFMLRAEYAATMAERALYAPPKDAAELAQRQAEQAAAPQGPFGAGAPPPPPAPLRMRGGLPKSGDQIWADEQARKGR